MHTGNIDHDVLLLGHRNQIKLGTTYFGWIGRDVFVEKLNYNIAHLGIKTGASVG